MISAVAPNLFNPSEAAVRATAYKLKATNSSLPTALISLPLSHTLTQSSYLCLQCEDAAGHWLLLSVTVFSLYQTSACCIVFKAGSMYVLSVLRCWARSSGCQDLSHICAVTQSFLSAVCLCLRGASHELSNEVLTITFLSRCCLWFYGKRETCMLKNHIWYWIHTETFACGFIIIKRLIKNGSKTRTVDQFPSGYLRFSECRPERCLKWKKKAGTES